MSVQLDSRHSAVPNLGGGWKLRQTMPGASHRYRESAEAYPTTAAAIRALIAETVKWGAWL